MAKIISGIYKIINTVTGDFYIGSSKNVKQRLACHKCPSTWKKCPNNPMYLDMQKYGVESFEFQILEVVEPEELKITEQQFIESLKPTYNNNNAKGLNIERRKQYEKSEKRKEYYKEREKSDKRKKYKKEYEKSEKRKKYRKEYEKSDKRKKYKKEYDNQLCLYEGKTLTFGALRKRFKSQGIEHPAIEAKKYLLNNSKDK